jgi:dienelactone hydrolase
MMTRMKLPKLFAAVGLLAVTTFTTVLEAATTCPSGAICRNEVAPGNYSGNGPYGYRSYTLSRLQTPGGATVYYPNTAKPPFSGLVFTPPYTGTQSMFRAWGPFFASHGIVLVTMDTSTTLNSVDQRASQQKRVLDALKNENTRSASPLRGKLDTARLGAVGWSMGGGATWINSAEYSGLKSAMSLAGHNLTAVDIDSKGYNTRVPTLILNGALDLTYLGGLGQSIGVYNNIPRGIPKVIYEVASAGHFAWGSPTAANRAVAGIALAFHKTFLDGDTRWVSYIRRPSSDVATWQTANLPQ